jgi:tryptophanyl-tRNA synthetase
MSTLANRVRLQDSHELFLLVADYHSLTTHPEKADVLATRQSALEVVMDNYAVGIDPTKVTHYLQSDVPETAELTLLFSMLITVPRLDRLPTLKDVMENLHITEPSAGLLNYPVLQAADILIVKGDLVPVGKDQASRRDYPRDRAALQPALRRGISEPEVMIPRIFSYARGYRRAGQDEQVVGQCDPAVR